MTPNPSRMTLALKWITFRRKVIPEDAGKEQVLFGQACFLGGAQAAFQILANASGASQEDAMKIWGSLQREIQQAAGAVTKEEPPKEQSRIIVV